MGFGGDDEEEGADSEGDSMLVGWAGQGTPGPGAYDAPSSFM